MLPKKSKKNSRIDIIEPTKVLEHPIAEIHVISRLTTKDTALTHLRFQPWWTKTKLAWLFPSHRKPMMKPGRGEGG